jgi:hypothetical protein
MVHLNRYWCGYSKFMLMMQFEHNYRGSKFVLKYNIKTWKRFPSLLFVLIWMVDGNMHNFMLKISHLKYCYCELGLEKVSCFFESYQWVVCMTAIDVNEYKNIIKHSCFLNTLDPPPWKMEWRIFQLDKLTVLNS